MSPHSPHRPEREKLHLSARVHCRESEGCEWNESTVLLDVSPFGARLRISRPTEVGRLLQLMLPMPRRLRSYDREEEQYVAWSLVRHVTLVPADDDFPHSEIGVAFIGKEIPKSHDADPSRRFDLWTRITGQELWSLREENPDDEERPEGIERRREERHKIVDEVDLEVYDEESLGFETDVAYTENISHHGMAVLTALRIHRGRYIRVRSAQYSIAVIAAVRCLAEIPAGSKRLHLEFVDQQWPRL